MFSDGLCCIGQLMKPRIIFIMSYFLILMLFLSTIVGRGVDMCKEQHVKGELHGRVELHGLLTNKQEVESVQWSKCTNGCSKRTLQNVKTTGYHNQMNFTLVNLTAEDQGMYQMAAVLTNGTIMRCNITLTVSLPPVALRIDVSSSNFTLSLTCKVQGEFLLLRWLWKGVPVPVDHRRSFSGSNQSMQVSNLTSADCGMYTCQVSNTVGQSETHMKITGEITTVCQNNNLSKYLYWILLPTGFTLFSTLLLLSIKYGCHRTDPSETKSTEPVYEVPVNLQEGAVPAAVNPLPYVYTDFIKSRSFQQLAAAEGQTEDSGYSTIAEVQKG